MRKLVTMVAGACVAAAGLAIPISPAAASTDCNYTFPSTGYPATRAGLQDLMDDGLAACPTSGDNVIITLTSGFTMDGSELTWSSNTTDLTLRGSVTITGNSANSILVANAPAGRTVTIDGLTITGGRTPTFQDYGGAVFFDGNGTLTISNATFSGNDADAHYGGAVGSYGSGQLLVSDSTFLSNGDPNDSGGAIYWEGDVTVDSSTFASNTGREGGAIYLDSGSLTVSNSTFNGNDAGDSGGAIYARPGTNVDIQTSTFVGNTAGVQGGAVSLEGNGTFLNSTLTGNTATGIGGAIYIKDDNLALDFVTLVENSPTNVESNDSAYATVRGSVFGLSGAGTNCGVGPDPLNATFLDSALAPATDTSCGSGFTPASWSELALGVLQGNGGPTQTMMPASSSILIDLADDSTVTALTSVDQRGYARSGAYTAGAVQYVASAPEPTPVYPPSAPTDVVATPGEASATVTWKAPGSSGSFAVTNYAVTSSPGGKICLAVAPATSCTIAGLTNGVAYTFTVRALNGAGWSPYSTPSAPVTPKAPSKPTIVITGSREASDRGAGRVIVNGVTTELAGAVVQARVHLAGEIEYVDGSTRRVSDDETFTWQRLTKKKVYVYFTTEDRIVRSNRLIIDP